MKPVSYSDVFNLNEHHRDDSDYKDVIDYLSATYSQTVFSGYTRIVYNDDCSYVFGTVQSKPQALVLNNVEVEPSKKSNLELVEWLSKLYLKLHPIESTPSRVDYFQDEYDEEDDDEDEGGELDYGI
jgi:hypothetical protein